MSIRLLGIPRPRGLAVGDPSQRQGAGIGQHMAGIGDERQRPGPPAADRLDDHKDSDQPEGRQNPVLAGRGSVMTVVRVIVSHNPALRLVRGALKTAMAEAYIDALSPKPAR